MHTHIPFVFKLSNILMVINRNTSKSNWLPFSNCVLFYYFAERISTGAWKIFQKQEPCFSLFYCLCQGFGFCYKSTPLDILVTEHSLYFLVLVEVINTYLKILIQNNGDREIYLNGYFEILFYDAHSCFLKLIFHDNHKESF